MRRSACRCARRNSTSNATKTSSATGTSSIGSADRAERSAGRRARIEEQHSIVDDFDTFIDSAWATHAEQPQATAERLATSLQRVETADQVPRYASLVTHVYGEHLGDIEGGIALLQRLGAQHAGAANGAAQRALARHVATLRQV